MTIGSCTHSGAGGAVPVTSQPPGSSSPRWMLTKAALEDVSSDQQVRDRLSRDHAYELLHGGQKSTAGVGAEPIATFPSVAQLRTAVDNAMLPKGATGVLYDPEVWAHTPRSEQQDPAAAIAEAARVAHQHKLTLMVSPALNLTTIHPGHSRSDSANTRSAGYLDQKLPATVARYADGLEIQAQSLERNADSYQKFVKAAAAQARTVRSDITIIAGLSTNPQGDRVTTEELAADVKATRDVVGGYWLNIPNPGSHCPGCNAPRPDLAISLLRSVS